MRIPPPGRSPLPAGLTGCVAGLLVLAVIGCGERSGPPRQWRFCAEPIYREPAEATDPHLIFARDLILRENRLYILDARLAHVVVCNPATGEIVSRFGSPGEGPGELGLYPHALVSDGDRIGIVTLFQVSWFTPAGEFLERAGVPPHDLATPSLDLSGREWLVNAAFRGTGSPRALLVDATGDTIALGRSEAPRHPDRTGLAASELNAVHVARFSDGGILLARVHENVIEFLDADGHLIGRDSWDHFPRRPARREDGRLRDLPGFTFAAGRTAEGAVWILDGTLRQVRLYGSGGTLLGRHVLEAPVVRLAWGRGALVYAVDGRDRILRLKLLGDRDEESVPAAGADPAGAGSGSGSGQSGEVESGSGRGESGEVGSGNRAAGLSLPGDFITPVDGIETLLRDRDLWREGYLTGPNSPPKTLLAAGGTTRLFVGYGDGGGMLCTPGAIVAEGIRIRPGRVTPVSPHGSYRSRIVMTGDEPVVWDARGGIFPSAPDRSLQWGRERFPSDVIALDHDRWLLCDMRIRSGSPLLIAEGAAGTLAAAGAGPGSGGSGERGSRHRWSRGWQFAPWPDGEVLIVDSDDPAIAIWQAGTSPVWTRLHGPGEEGTVWPGGESPGEGLGLVTAVPGRGALFTFSALYRGEEISWLGAAGADGSLLGFRPFTQGVMISSLTRGPGGGIWLTTRRELYLWQGVEEIFEGNGGK